MISKHDWSDHNRHCKKKLSQSERSKVRKSPPKQGLDSRMACLTIEQQQELIDAGSLPELFPEENCLTPCKTCGRKFNPDRIEKHQRICYENSKKRKLEKFGIQPRNVLKILILLNMQERIDQQLRLKLQNGKRKDVVGDKNVLN
eukprot:UN34087